METTITTENKDKFRLINSIFVFLLEPNETNKKRCLGILNKIAKFYNIQLKTLKRYDKKTAFVELQSLIINLLQNKYGYIDTLPKLNKVINLIETKHPNQ